MSSRLSAAERRKIINNYKNWILNEEYRVLDRGNGKYQVRKHESKFKMSNAKPKSKQPEPKPEPEQKQQTINHMTNEELLRKLSSLLTIPEQEVDGTPLDYEHEEEAYEQTQQYINVYADAYSNQPRAPQAQPAMNPYRRQPLRLY